VLPPISAEKILLFYIDKNPALNPVARGMPNKIMDKTGGNRPF
jgi:hypothetical protein